MTIFHKFKAYCRNAHAFVILDHNVVLHLCGIPLMNISIQIQFEHYKIKLELYTLFEDLACEILFGVVLHFPSLCLL